MAKCNHHRREKGTEGPVVRLMVENMHTDRSTDRAEKPSDQEQGAFRHPALVLSRTLFVTRVWSRRE